MSNKKAYICGILLIIFMVIVFGIMYYYKCVFLLKLLSFICIAIQMGEIATKFYNWLIKKT